MLKIVKPHFVDVISQGDATIEEGALVGYCPPHCTNREPVILGDGVYIHAGAIIYPGCKIGAHSHVYHHSVLLPNTIIGAHCKVGSLVVSQGNVTLEDWVTVASHCHLTPYLVIERGAFLSVGISTGNALHPGGRLHPHDIRQELHPPRIGRGARIGGNVMINPNVVIGAEALIGGGAVVVKSIPDFAIAIGVPARVVGEIPDRDRIDWSSPDARGSSCDGQTGSPR